MSFARGFLSGLSGCIINIYVILHGEENLFEMGAVRSARESRSVALVWWLGILVTGAWFCAHAWETIIASSGLQLLWEGYVFFLCASCII